MEKGKLSKFKIVSVGLSMKERQKKDAQIRTAKAYLRVWGIDPKYMNQAKLFRYMQKAGLAWDDDQYVWRNEHDLIDEGIRKLFEGTKT